MKGIVRILFALPFIIFTGYSYLQAQENAQKKEEPVILYKGETKALPVSNPTRVAVGNPNIADVASVSKGDMLISAKNTGATNLIWWDDAGEHILQLQVFLENMSAIKERIDSFLKELGAAGVFTRQMDSEGKVLLLGDAKSSQDIERISVALASFKDKTVNLIKVKEEEAVIGIDVQVLELDKDATETLGFSWPGSITLTERGSVGINTTLGSKWSTLFKVVNLSRDAFSWTLDALVQEGKARILSQPHLACQSGKEAELLVGGEKPIFTTIVAATTGAEGTKVEYKEFGIKLKIKPTVTEKEKIKLGLNVEVSEVGAAETIGSSSAPTAKAYPLTKRNASTELFLSDGQSMAIGGLKKQKSEEDIRKTPFLGNIPVLGWLFKKRTTKAGGGQGEKGDVELFITLTPTIMKKETAQVKEEVKVETPASKKETPELKEPEPQVTVKIEEAKEEIPEEKKWRKKEKQASEEWPKIKAPNQAVADYIIEVTRRIQDNFTYPWAAKEANLQGVLMLAVRLAQTGELLGAEIKQSSGFSVLDENALRIVEGLAPYPSFPAEIKEEELLIDLPIIYKTEP